MGRHVHALMIAHAACRAAGGAAVHPTCTLSFTVLPPAGHPPQPAHSVQPQGGRPAPQWHPVCPASGRCRTAADGAGGHALASRRGRHIWRGGRAVVSEGVEGVWCKPGSASPPLARRRNLWQRAAPLTSSTLCITAARRPPQEDTVTAPVAHAMLRLGRALGLQVALGTVRDSSLGWDLAHVEREEAAERDAAAAAAGGGSG